LAQNKNWLQIRAEYLIASSLFGALRHLPLPAANRVASSIAQLLDRSVPKLRRVGLTNLRFAFPEATEAERNRIIDGVFQTIARLLVAMARFPTLNSRNIHDLIGYEGLENYERAKQEGRGILVATAHLGNWELSAFSHALMTERMNIMVRPLDNPLIDRLVEHYRTLSGNGLIFKRDAARGVLKALKNNEAVGILIDQNTVATEGVFVPFFGKSACAGTAFVKLAYHSGAPVIPGFAFWNAQTGRYILRFYPKMQLCGDAAADTARIQQFFEATIRQYPDQWMWIHRRWKTRPPGEPQIY
jgi:Kdo2-lipid IVA lauroyltransferase/acyltransferase